MKEISFIIMTIFLPIFFISFVIIVFCLLLEKAMEWLKKK